MMPAAVRLSIPLCSVASEVLIYYVGNCPSTEYSTRIGPNKVKQLPRQARFGYSSRYIDYISYLTELYLTCLWFCSTLLKSTYQLVH